VKRLLDEGHEVIALDYKEGLKSEELRAWGARVLIGSVTDRNVLRECMPGSRCSARCGGVSRAEC
jgi:Trk K+ transport system NAD-binding subunit